MKKFKLFDMNRDGPGVSKDEKPLKPTLWNLPKLYCRKFPKLLSLNFVMLPIWIIPFLEAYLYVTAGTMPTQSHGAFSTLYGISLINPSPAVSSLVSVYGFQTGLQTYDTTRIIIAIALIVVLAAVWGWINTGAAYITREMFKGEAVFIWSDFIYAIKRNLWQGLVLGLIDFAALGMLAFDLFYFSMRGGTFVLDFMFFAICGVIAVYMFMRFYMYTILVTFNIKTVKLLKNSLIFSVLGIKRNLIGLAGILLLVLINGGLLLMFWAVNAPFLGVFIILPVVYLLPSIAYCKTYAAYPVIEKYMID